MGMDLYLLPFDCDFPDISFSHTLLRVENAGDLWDDFKALNRQDVPPDFTSYVSSDGKCEESHYGVTTEDCYGDRLKYVKSGDLIRYKNRIAVKESKHNLAVWAYLAGLDPDNKIALYWH